MIVRDALNDQVVLIKQSDHADLAAQFAAHFGNEQFAPVQPFVSVVRATTYHDSHFQDVEAKLPIDIARGRPYGHRETPFSQAHIDALRANISWLVAEDPYSGLLVSMHHSGLPQNRYGLVSSWRTRDGVGAQPRTIRPEVAANIQILETEQATLRKRLIADRVATDNEINTNYRLLQFFDLLSLYLCSDGYRDGKLVPTWIGPVPMNYEGFVCQEIRVQPVRGIEIKLSPYPFGSSELRVSVPVRFVQQHPGHDAVACREAIMKATREYLSWVIVP
jgi:hypothetical protein